MASSTSQILFVELSDFEDRHLNKCPAEVFLSADHEGKRFKTEVELLELCILIIPPYRASTWDTPSDDDLAKRLARFQTFCWVELKKADLSPSLNSASAVLTFMYDQEKICFSGMETLFPLRFSILHPSEVVSGPGQT